MSSSPDAGNSASNTTNTPSLGVILGQFVQSSNDIITDRARLLAAAPTSDPDASVCAHGSQISAGSLTHINPAVAKRLIKAAANKTYSSELLRHMAGPITTMTTAMKEMYSTDGDTAAASIAYFLGTELALGAERIATKKLMTQFLDQPALHPSAPRTNGHLNAFERMCGTTIESLGENSLMTAASRILDLTAAAKKAEDDMRAAAVLSALSSADPKWRDELARQIVEGRRYDPDLEPSYMTFGPGATAQDIATQLQLAAEQLKASMDPEQNLQVAGAGKQFFKSAEMALDNAVEKLVEERVERLTSNAAETDTAASSCRALASTSDPKGKGKDVAVQPARDEMDDIHDRALRDQEAACKLSELNQSVKALSAALAKMAAGASKVVGEDGTVSIEAFLQVMRDRSQDDSGLGEATQEANKIHFRQSARVTALALASLCIPDNPEQRQFSVDLLEGIRKMDREVWPNRVPPLDAQYLVPLSELEDEAGAAQDHSKRKREKSSSGASVNTEDLRRGGRESSEDASPVRQRTAQEIWEERRAQLLKDDPEYLKLPAESAPAVATDLQETESESEDGSSSDPGTPPKVSSPQKADSPKTDDDGASIAMSLEPPESADEEIETQAVAPAASKTLLEQVEAAISTERSQARQYLLDALSGAKVSQSKQIEKGSAEGAGSGRIGG